MKDSRLDHFSAESEESSSDSNGQDSSRQSGSSSKTTSAKTSSGDSGRTQESTETSETSTSQTSLMSMSSQEASLVKMSAGQVLGGGVQEGERSGLWSEYRRAISEVGPEYAIVENVTDLSRRGLSVVLGDLAEEGYNAEWHDIRARDLGFPHKRERLFIIAYPDEARCHSGRQSDTEGWSGGLGEGMEPESESAHEDTLQGRELLLDSYAWKDGIQRVHERQIQGQRPVQRLQDIERVEDLRGRSDIPEPLLRGGNNGVPDRMDRTKALGNAVVPACAELIGEAIGRHEFR